MAKEIGIFLSKELGGFAAGTTDKDGNLSKNAHLITEDEIISMTSILIRTYVAKTGKDTLVVQGVDGKAMMIKLVEIKAIKDALEKRKRSNAPVAKAKKKKA